MKIKMAKTALSLLSATDLTSHASRQLMKQLKLHSDIKFTSFTVHNNYLHTVNTASLQTQF